MPKPSPHKPFEAFAQNFEDVILNRALHDIELGCYVDIGAHDPIICSVSYGFYKCGWRGVHVDPSPEKAAALRSARPDELVLQAAVTTAPGPITFYEGDESSTGLSTGAKETHLRHIEAGLSFTAISVETLTLDQVFAGVEGKDIHWLKIDVEGMEKAVLESWTGQVRPWIVVIEATEPGDPTQTHAKWESLLLQLGYAFVYFDGLNRFYLHQNHMERAKHFGPGPNVFDCFVYGETEGIVGVEPLGHRLKSAQQRIAKLEHEVLALRMLLQSDHVKARHLPKLVRHLGRQHPGQVSGASAPQRRGRGVVRGLASWISADQNSLRYNLGRAAARRLLLLLRKHKGLHAIITEKVLATPALHRLANHFLAPQTSSHEAIEAGTNEQLAGLRLRIAAGGLPKHRPADLTKPRMAFVTPLPPDQSGVADYSAALLPSLAQYYEIDGVVQGDPAAVHSCDGLRRVISTADFRACAFDYDRIVYNIGNAHFHTDAFALSKEFPGILLMHGTFLGEITLALASDPSRSGYANNALWEEGGYAALQQRYSKDGTAKVCQHYPMLFSLAKFAQGVLTTNHHALAGLRSIWNGSKEIPLAQVQLGRQPAPISDKAAARERLGLAQDAFVVGCFGYLVPTKSNQAVLDAFIAAGLLADDLSSHLFFVGSCLKASMAPNLDTANGRASITGYVDEAVYRDYLAAADIAVQLRSSSRGESSGTVLDALAYGLPTIVNANGSLAELPDGVVIKVPDGFDTSQLADAIQRLHRDEALRQSLSQEARAYLERAYNPNTVAALYHSKIEELVAQARPENSLPRIAEHARKTLSSTPTDEAVAQAARALVDGRTFPVPARRLLFDVTGIALLDHRTGIQRTLRAQLLGLFASPPPGFLIEPVRLIPTPTGVELVFARKFAAEFLGLAKAKLPDLTVDLHAGDVFFGADFNPLLVPIAAQQGLFQDMRAKSMGVYFTIYDVLPIDHPEYFPPETSGFHTTWLRTIAGCSDGLICISHTVRQQTESWLEQTVSPAPTLRLAAAPLGYDIDKSQPTSGMPSDADEVLGAVKGKLTFLAVGSVCPRRGYEQLLPAFEQLWDEGQDVNLVIVGSALWPERSAEDRRIIPQVEAALNACEERGKRLFWLQGISDEYLQAMYESADVFITASRGEGFGLPLVEAAAHGLPIIARDIPVFREIAGEKGAYYFSGSTPQDLALAIQDWQALFAKREHPRSDSIQGYTWGNNRKALLAAMGLPDEQQQRPQGTTAQVAAMP